MIINCGLEYWLEYNSRPENYCRYLEVLWNKLRPTSSYLRYQFTWREDETGFSDKTLQISLCSSMCPPPQLRSNRLRNLHTVLKTNEMRADSGQHGIYPHFGTWRRVMEGKTLRNRGHMDERPDEREEFPRDHKQKGVHIRAHGVTKKCSPKANA